MFWSQSTAFGIHTRVAPALIDVRRKRVLVERVRADGEMVHDPRADRVPARAMEIAVERDCWKSLNGTGSPVAPFGTGHEFDCWCG